MSLGGSSSTSSRAPLIAAVAAGAVGAVAIALLYSRGPKSSGAGKTSTASRIPREAEPAAPGAASSPVLTTEPVEPCLLVVFASATGTAEQFAKGFSREARAKGLNAVCADAAELQADSWLGGSSGSGPVRALAMFVATAGDGDPPESYKQLFDGLRAMQRGDCPFLSSGLPFAVFGLGDTSYVHFNKSAKDTSALLERLGGRQLLPVALGDAKGDLEAQLDEWKEGVWDLLADELGVSLETGDIVPEYTFSYLPPPAGAATAAATTNATGADPCPFAPPPSQLEPSQAHPLFVPMMVKRELLNADAAAADSRRSTLHIELDISNTCITYQAGDHCGVLAPNDDELVRAYLARIDLHDKSLPLLSDVSPHDLVVELCTRVRERARFSLRNILPARVSLFDALKWYCDLAGKPKKSTLRALSQYCTDAAERDAFRALLSRDQTAAYNALLSQVRTVLGVLSKFPSCRPPVGHFIEVMPRIAPRYYSIASDQQLHKKVIHLTVAIEDGGHCSRYFSDVAQPMQTRVAIFVRKSSFHLPIRAKQKPLIFIGPGTGLAPLRGFCQRREAWAAKKAELGPCTLFFGCRREAEDFIYRDELEAHVRSGILTEIVTAFSRDDPAKKVYVQDRLTERADLVRQTLRDGGSIFVCGDAAGMAVGVENALVAILVADGLADATARDELDKLTKAGRYLKDVW